MTRDYETIGLAIFLACSVLPVVPLAFVGVDILFRHMRGLTQRPRVLIRFTVAAALAGIVYAVVIVDAYLIEPNWPELTRITIEADIAEPLQILHLTDLHIEPGNIPRQHWLLEQLKLLDPDLILITGDIHQMGMFDVEVLRGILSHISAPLGVYGCVGYDHYEVLKEANPSISYLVNDTALVEHGGDTIGIAGLVFMCGHAAAYDSLTDAKFKIVMQHSPDFADEAAENGADLYLCGHTHGGQVRIPFWGAIITNSKSGKKYESGQYMNGNTHIYTSRGLGLEPPSAPQVRFLCRPEIVLFDIVPR